MNTQELKEEIRRELPDLLRNDLALRAFIAELMGLEFPRRSETNDRFYQMLEELRHDREEQTRKWEEQKQADRLCREEDTRKWEAQQRLNELQARKWEEQKEQDRLLREEQARKWEEQKQKDELLRQEQSRTWEEVKAESDRHWDEMRADSEQRWQVIERRMEAALDKFDRRICAMGARWGTESEKAFRDALAAILEQSFGVQVINVNDFDDSGEVFGRPDQVELDIIIQNGLLLILELKSSVTKADMYIFERKARFYEKRHQRTANRLIVVSPMIDRRAHRVGERLGIEMYGDSMDVPLQ